jgi:hypothetical protein
MTHVICRGLVLLATAALLAACSSTTLTGSWKDPAFRGPVQKIYIVGIAKVDLNRRIFEDSFARELEVLGTKALPSYRDLPLSDQDSQAAITAQLNKSGADSILLARVTDRRIEQVTSPGYATTYYGGGGGWGGYYNSSYSQTMYTPSTTTEFQIATIEANLYETKTGKLIWSAQLETVIENNLDKLFTDFAKTVTTDLKKDGLI